MSTINIVVLSSNGNHDCNISNPYNDWQHAHERVEQQSIISRAFTIYNYASISCL